MGAGSQPLSASAASGVVNAVLAASLATVGLVERRAAWAVAAYEAELADSGPPCALRADGRLDQRGCVCSDFSERSAAQRFYDAVGAAPGAWPMDPDGDGVFCEELDFD